MFSTVSGKGQVTIPKEIRAFLDIKPGDKINFTMGNGRVILAHIKALGDLRGSVPAKGELESERRLVRVEVGKRAVEEMESKPDRCDAKAAD